MSHYVTPSLSEIFCIFESARVCQSPPYSAILRWSMWGSTVLTSRAPEITDTNVIELTDQLQQRLYIYINVFPLQTTHH